MKAILNSYSSTEVMVVQYLEGVALCQVLPATFALAALLSSSPAPPNPLTFGPLPAILYS
jgi:hypothetical protein